MGDVMQELCRQMRMGNMPGGGGARPIKYLAFIAGRSYEKDLCLMRHDDLPICIFRRALEMELPKLPDDGSMMYSMSYIPDERIAYKIFENRRRGRNGRGKNDDAADAAAKEDAAILDCCLMCDKKVGLRRCSRCRRVAYCGKEHQMLHWKGAGNEYGRGSEWAHKKSCPRMEGRPLRLNIDDMPDDMPLSEVEADLTYGFILVERVPRQGKGKH